VTGTHHSILQVGYLDFLPDEEAFNQEYDLSLETDYGI
jgi:hypothetical protein